MINVTKVEIHASNACNLTCESCSHFSNNGHKGFIKPEEADYQMGLWSHRLNPIMFSLLGGEPLLNPQIDEIIKITRKHWTCNIEFVTNGLLFPKCLNTGKLLNELGFNIVISKHSYDDEYEKLYDEALKFLDKNNVHYFIRDSVKRWTRRYKGFGPDVMPFEDNNPESSWKICPCKSCLQILDCKLYKCAVIAYLQLQKKRWPQISPKWDRYLAYKPLEHTATDAEVEEFVNRKHESICEMCPAEPDRFVKASPLIPVGELLQRLKKV